ncbi:SusC/RagA family TonB-linked outer membrane protein [Mucilaginibacter sp. UR6-11]|uniref:SusC/RagA family TonB-linked outer membrane protein n=1 Tax=Mucilaginibacter sp. UR6-11 TaxID=1435644 RepID=UPI001E3F8A0C|nr:SusC/RagA family TonB-linked outer membrane protein [Mucilaginibacter sp. UR6-11]MCC8423482.1 SusC/RagA family TonB-linked outer membrane protein [Mucilaginibacter sp. UR6-11]
METFAVKAQNEPAVGPRVVVSGVVKDASETLPGVSVVITGTSIGVNTDVTGAFSLKVPVGKSITVSMLGYIAQTINITEAKSNLIVVLKTDQKNLKDVVIIGYQTVSRKTLSAAVTSVDPKTIADMPAPTFDALLQGRVAGLNVQNFSGEPGARSNVVLRGNTAVSRNIDNNTSSASGKASLARAISGPLYVIDGVPQSTEDIAAINYGSGTGTDLLAGIPIGDIESIDILKDASAAAVYGSRGSNGVIIITTKKGVAGKTRINFSTYHGITGKPNLDKVLTGAEETRAKLDLINHYGNYNNLNNIPQILTDTLNPAFNNNNDYRKELYQTGIVDNYELSVTGGNDLVTYRYGLNYYNESGIIKKTGLQRYSINSTVGINISKRLKVSTQIRFYRVDRPTSLSDVSGNINPFTGGYYPTNALPPSNLYLTQANKDYIYGSTLNNTDNNTNNSVTISPTIDWKISDHFAFNSVLSYESAGSRKDTFTPGAVRQSGYGYASSFVDNSANYLVSSNIQYNTTLGKDHHLNVLAGQNMEYHNYRATSATADGIPNDQISVVKVLDKNGSTAFSDLLESGISTEFVRVNYDYKQKYLLSAVMNADASSKFGPGNRVGFFPSVSAGWVISDEDFMKPASSWLTILKLRGSYGITGRQPDSGDNYLSFNSYNIGAGGFAGSNSPQTGANLSTTYNGVAAISPNFAGSLSNADLTWEHSKQANLGLDATFLDGRFNLVLDAYVRNTSKGIFTLDLPVTTGYQTIITNSIGTQNKGLEASFIAHYFNPRNAFQWETDFNIAYNTGEITALPNGGRDIYIDKFVLRQGQPMNEYNVFLQTGVYKTDKDVPINPVTGGVLNFYGYPFKGGDPIWKDSNGDGTLDASDYVPAGNPAPKFTGGFNNVFGYKNWTFSVFCTFTLDRSIFNEYLVGKLSHLVPTDDGDPNPYHDLANNAFPDLSGINYWKNPGDNATYPSLSSVSGTRYKYAQVQSAWIENGNYMRIKTVSLGYTFKPSVVKSLHISRLRVYGMVDNLHIFQKSNVPDAEEVDAYGIYNGNGYPIPKKFTLGLDLSL